MGAIHHPILTTAMLAIAVALANVCAIGVLVMHDALQRLQYATPVVCISAWCIVIAVWLEDPDPQARIKVILIGVILFVMNAILSHATARAIRIRKLQRWAPTAEERLPLVGADGKPK
jgi:multisubunit Na+/H+ antiporter MnhG subunit